MTPLLHSSPESCVSSCRSTIDEFVPISRGEGQILCMGAIIIDWSVESPKGIGSLTAPLYSNCPLPWNPCSGHEFPQTACEILARFLLTKSLHSNCDHRILQTTIPAALKSLLPRSMRPWNPCDHDPYQTMATRICEIHACKSSFGHKIRRPLLAQQNWSFGTHKLVAQGNGTLCKEPRTGRTTEQNPL